jgi:predicted phage-related endonuclease
MIERIDLTGKSREQWLDLRRPDVTASRSGALFGVDPYCSPLRLYHEKAGLLDLAPDNNSPILRRGRLFESAVAEAVREERPDWEIVKANEYLRDPEIRLGATPDFYIKGDPRGLGVLQCKTCSAGVFDREWRGEGQLPFVTTLQVLTEAMLAGAAFGAAAALKIDAFNVEVAIVEVPRHEASEQRIRDAVVRFWDDVKNGREPPPDYGLDRDLIAALSPQEFAGKVINLEGDNEVMAGLAERADLKAQTKRAADRCAEIEAMIMQRMGDAESIVGVPDFRVTWRTTKFKEYTVKAREQRVLRILDRREDDAA